VKKKRGRNITDWRNDPVVLQYGTRLSGRREMLGLAQVKGMAISLIWDFNLEQTKEACLPVSKKDL